MLDKIPDDRTVSRRDFMTGLATVWITASIACSRDTAQSATRLESASPGAMADTPPPPQRLTHFSPSQAAEIDAIAARIIPSDDSPGAREAGVLYFIDATLGTFAKSQAPLFDAGLVALSKDVAKFHSGYTSFASLTAAQQDDMLRRIEKTPFFGAMRFATIAGFLSLPRYGGNRDYVGWKFIGQDHTAEYKPPFGWYDRPENQMALLGKVL